MPEDQAKAKAEAALTNELGNLVAQWEELGIEPDAFVTCGTCHKIFNFAATANDYTIGNVCGCE